MTYPIKHISIRVPWHDNKWNGTICKNPSENSYCLTLARIYEEKDADEEDKIAGKTENIPLIIAPTFERITATEIMIPARTPRRAIFDGL